MTVMTRIAPPRGSEPRNVVHGQHSPDQPDPRFVILRHVVTCRERLGLNKGDISVLRALLFCLHKSNGTLVFASNATLAAHADGTPVRTLSRHIKRLVDAGFVERRDSPTKRRYLLRSRQGPLSGYGLDLAPLFAQAEIISTLAREVEDEAARVAMLRDRMSCLANLLCDHGQHTELVLEARRERRRKANPDRIIALINALENALPSRCEANDMADADSQNGRPDQKAILEELSDRPVQNTEPPTETGCKEAKKNSQGRNSPMLSANNIMSDAPIGQMLSADNIALDISDTMTPRQVLSFCPEAAAFSTDRSIASWHDLAAFAWDLAGWMCIDQSTVREVAKRIGVNAASATIMAICQSGSKIKSPGAYLRKLGRTDGFNPARFLKRLGADRISGTALC